MYKAGRYTAALLLIAAGGALLADRMLHTEWLGVFAKWWPALLILLGIEYLLFTLFLRNRGEKLKLDIGSLIFTGLIAAALLVFMQPGGGLTKLQDMLQAAGNGWSSLGKYDGESGHRFAKGITRVPLASATERLVVDNPNGGVAYRMGPVSQVEIDVTVFVGQSVTEEEAKRIADESTVQYREGAILRVTAEPRAYGANQSRKPRMNLIVTIPDQARVDVETVLMNGSVDAAALKLGKAFAATTKNGSIKLHQLEGSVQVKTVNGSIEADNITGSFIGETVNGSVRAIRVGGDVEAKTVNGALTAAEAAGNLDLKTTNGAIQVSEALRSAKLRTTNGKIEITSGTIGGDWSVKTTHGSIIAAIPDHGDYKLDAEANGRTTVTGLPFATKARETTGTIGSGKHSLQFDTNGSLELTRLSR